MGGSDQNLEHDHDNLSDFHPDRENDEDESDSSSLHSVLSQIAREEKRALKKKTNDVPKLSTSHNKNDSSNDEESSAPSEFEISQSRQHRITPKRPTSKPSSSKKAARSHRTRTKEPKRARSNSSDSSTKQNSSKQTRKKRCDQKQLSMADAMIQEAQILDQRERETTRLNDERQGQAVIDQGKERLLWLRVSLQRQINQLYAPPQNASSGVQEDGEEDSQLGIDLNDLQEEH